MKPSLRCQKRLCRKKLRRVLDHLSDAKRKKKSAKITKKIIKLPVFRKARRILIYLALPKEVQTMALVRTALRLRKKVYAPVVDPIKRDIRAAAVRQPSRDLKKGAYGIPEPKGWRRDGNQTFDFDIIIVPGLGFDRVGRRIGRGAGYFDRFLRKAGRSYKVGVAFSEQMLKKIPAGNKDVRMDAVITD